MIESGTLQAWAQHVIGEQITRTARALSGYCRKPRSGKRLHRARKALARLRAALQDLGAVGGTTPEFASRVHELHRRAGRMRDADVLIDRVDVYMKELDGGECSALQTLRDSLRKRRKRARRKFERIVREVPELRA
jgi:CHAD domain-containing protein